MNEVIKLNLPEEIVIKFENRSSGSSSITVDDTLSDTSTNPVQNKVVSGALTNLIMRMGDMFGNVSNDVSELYSRILDNESKIETKQDSLSFDTAPTIDSYNPVTSNGVALALSEVADTKVNKQDGYMLVNHSYYQTYEGCYGLNLYFTDGLGTNLIPDYEMVKYEIALATKPTIITSIIDDTLTLYHNQDARLGELTSLTLLMPEVMGDAYHSEFSFVSGETATSLIYSSTPLIWRGDDVDSDGVFVPEPNTAYEISIKNLGSIGIVARVGVV